MADQTPGPQKNTLMGVLCYLGILVLIPLLTEAKKDPFVKFHTRQGLVLFILNVIVGAIAPIPFLGWFIVGPLGFIFVLVLAIMGIVNVVNGVEKQLPVIGQYGDKFNI